MDSRLEKLKQALESAVDGMSGEQLLRHPENKWCAAEVLEHLYLTYTGTIRGFQKLLEAGKPLATEGRWRFRWNTFVVVGLGYLPAGRKAPSVTLPKGLPWQKVKRELGEKIVAMDAIIAECEGRLGHRVPLLNHPLLGPLTATQWRKFHLVHGLHHRKQLLRLLEDTSKGHSGGQGF